MRDGRKKEKEGLRKKEWREDRRKKGKREGGSQAFLAVFSYCWRKTQFLLPPLDH